MIPVLLAVLVQSDAAWWDRDWSRRRPIEVRNNFEGILPEGHPVGVELNPEFLGLRALARPDLADLVVVHKGKRLPSARMPGRSGSRIVLWFPTAEPIPESARDGGYFIYYGNPDPAGAPPAAPFGIFETFDDATKPPAFLETAPPVSMSIESGSLRIRDAAPSRPATAPARVLFKVPTPDAGFALRMDLVLEDPGVGTAVAAVVDLAVPGAEDPTVAPRVRKLLARLSHPDWELREDATRELIKIGPAGTKEIEKAVTAGDAEVRWRARHCLRTILENSPPPVIRAGLHVGDPEAPPVALTFAIGKLRGRQRHRPGSEVRMRIDLRRDQDGDVMLLWDGSRVQTGHLPGRPRSIALTFVHPGGDPPPSIRVDTLVLRAALDEESWPTTVLDLEERRP